MLKMGPAPQALAPVSRNSTGRSRLRENGRIKTSMSSSLVVLLRAQFDKTFVDMNPPDFAARQGLFFRAESRKKRVLLHLQPFAARDDFCGADFQSAADLQSAWRPGSQSVRSSLRGSGADGGGGGPSRIWLRLYCLVGQSGNLRPIGNRPGECSSPAGVRAGLPARHEVS